MIKTAYNKNGLYIECSFDELRTLNPDCYAGLIDAYRESGICFQNPDLIVRLQNTSGITQVEAGLPSDDWEKIPA